MCQGLFAIRAIIQAVTTGTNGFLKLAFFMARLSETFSSTCSSESAVIVHSEQLNSLKFCSERGKHVTLYSVKQEYNKTIVHIVRRLNRMRDICTESKAVVRCEGASGSRKVSAPESGIAHCGFDTRVAQLTPC